MGDLLVSTGNGVLVAIPSGLLNDIPKVGNDIRRTSLKGHLRPRQRFSGNFVECRIEQVEFKEIDFARCDWKDCRITDSTFVNCDLGHASVITNAFERCHFVGCRFPDTGISDSRFLNCEFTSCDFTSIIVKGSRFEKATFDRCITSNRIIESSLLIDTRWIAMKLDAQLILGNFGLLQNECENCELVTSGPNKEIAARQWSELSDIVAASDPSPIEFLRYRFFENGDLEEDPRALDAALNLRNWGSDAVVEASLAAQLSGFAQFLIALFDRNCLAIYPILILHSRNFEILSWLESRSQAAGLYQVSAGVHWILTREVETYMRIVDDVARSLFGQSPLHFAANGPADMAYFRDWLDETGFTDVAVVSVRPRNSPVDLAVVFKDHTSMVALVALFLACRTKIELSRLPKPTATSAGENANRPGEVFAVSAGFLPARAAEYELSVRTLLPQSLLLDLRLSINVSLFLRAKRVLVDLIATNEPSGQPGSEKHQPKSPPKSRRSPRT